MGTAKKRYRYIFCGLVNPTDSISDFRLVSAVTAANMLESRNCIRVEIPADLTLHKWSCDSYSTTYDKRTLKELNAVVYDRRLGRIDEKLNKMWQDGIIQPHQFYLHR